MAELQSFLDTMKELPFHIRYRITHLHQMAQNQDIRAEITAYQHYCTYLHGTHLTPSFIKNIKRYELIIFLMGEFSHPDDMPNSINNRILQLKDLIPNYDFLWFKIRKCIFKDEYGIFIDK